MSRKTYVLDTNVLLYSPDSMFEFDDNLVYIPITVIDEIDKFKKEQNELGRNARQVARYLDELRKKGRLDKGVETEDGGIIKIVLNVSETSANLPVDLSSNVPDNRILSVAIAYSGILVSRDINLRVKADALGITAEDYRSNSVQTDQFYSGTGEGCASPNDLVDLFKNGLIESGKVKLSNEIIYPNQCITIHNEENDKQTALTRYNAVMKEFKLVPDDIKVLGLTPKNAEQRYAMDLLLDPEVSIVTISGKAGGGKSLCAIAAGLHGVMESKLYKKMLLFKPIVSLDNSHELGFMPGDLKSKLDPWMASYYDAISYLIGSPSYEEPIKIKKGRKKESWEDKGAAVISPVDELIALDLLELGSLENLRGRSIPNQFIICDESQNLTNHALKTIITRSGEGTKIVLLADTEQIDLPYLSAENNGFVYTAEKFKESFISGHIKLSRSVRSRLAEEAATLL